MPIGLLRGSFVRSSMKAKALGTPYLAQTGIGSSKNCQDVHTGRDHRKTSRKRSGRFARDFVSASVQYVRMTWDPHLNHCELDPVERSGSVSCLKAKGTFRVLEQPLQDATGASGEPPPGVQVSFVREVC